MQQSVFVAELQSAGYTEIDSKTLDPRPANAGHAQITTSKDWCSMAVSSSTKDGNPVTYRAGEVFAVPAGKSHTEEIGPNGVRIVVGRKY